MRVTRSASEVVEPATGADGVQSKQILAPSKITKKIMIFPQLNHKNGAGALECSEVVHLRHPKQETIVPFLLMHQSGNSSLGQKEESHLMELNQYHEPFRSWFIGDFVVEDGSVHLATPINPLFLAIPYLIRDQKQFKPLDQILDDRNDPSPDKINIAISKLIHTRDLLAFVKLVCDVKNVSGSDEVEEFVFRLNDSKLLNWLSGRFDRLFAATDEDKGHSGISDLGTMRRYCFGLLADYLPTHIELVLKDFLKIEDISNDCNVDEKSREFAEKLPSEAKEPGESSRSPVAKRAKRSPLKPKEDYYDQKLMLELKKAASSGDSSKLTVSQKQLKKASTGTKSLSAFFKKK